MKSQLLKDWMHFALGKVCILNYYRLKLFSRAKLKSKREDKLLWLHLGCGNKSIKGMINIDVNPFAKSDLWLDLNGSLPFESMTVDAVYCCHTLEHFYEPDVRKILRGCFRILKPGGSIRVVTPDFQKAILAYQRNELSYFSDFPDKRRSIGGRFANYLLCRDQHRIIFDFSFWEELLQDEGFTGISEMRPHQSKIFPENELKIFEYEKPEHHHSVFVEAFKQL
jgi:SAM-dependent methyltransferase